MVKFIEIPILLQQNDPNDPTDYDSLDIDPGYEKVFEEALLNVSDVQRVNRSGMKEYETVIWTYDGGHYHTSLPYEQVRELIEGCCGKIPTHQSTLVHDKKDEVV
jgi:hypothetical protein